MNEKLDEIYNLFVEKNKECNLFFTRNQFDDFVHNELNNNTALPVNSTFNEKLDYILENYSKDFIVNSIFKNLSLNNNLSNFNFNNKLNCCLAPHTTLNFDTQGNIRVCCYNQTHTLGKYPETSIQEAWNSEKRKQLIHELSNKNFLLGCEGCKYQINSGNRSNAHFTRYDNYEQVISNYPIALELECSNVCNFECIMCGGEYSSLIRRNRENLPPLKNVYDQKFVEQITHLIPNLLQISFLGGEPFLISLYENILEQIEKLNPNLTVNITTNGSIFNSKVLRWLQLKNLNLTVSLDSLNKYTFESIRVNSNFMQVISNVRKFLSLKKLKNVAFSPMIQNVKELPSIVEFCESNQLSLIINTVSDSLSKTKCTAMPSFTLNSLPKEEIHSIISYLSKFKFRNKQYNDFINYLQKIY